MVKFAHIADSHLGGWRQPELQKLNSESFESAIKTCISESVEFILFTGDLFDSSFPPIEILKFAFGEFRKLKEAGIRCYIIAGSHDYSVSGKTFLDVLEKAGFCELAKSETSKDGKIILTPISHKSIYIYGYPGKKSGLEVDDLRKIKIIEPYSGYFRILMLHTTIKKVSGTLPIDAIEISEVPKADYYALGHIHIKHESEFDGKPVIYGGPTFPNNFKELSELKYGSFYIIDVGGFTKVTRKEIILKEIELIEIEITDSLKGTEKILNELSKKELTDKIILIKVYGKLLQGKPSDIKFTEIEEYLEKSGVYVYLKNTSNLVINNNSMTLELPNEDMDHVEEVLIKNYEKGNPSKFNKLIFPLLETLGIEKQEGEKQIIFESRLFSELNKILNIDLSLDN